MAILTAVRDILADDDAIGESVAERIFFIEAPQKVALPAIVLHLISESDGRHLGGSNRYPVARVVVDIVAGNYPDAANLGDDVRFALIDYRGTVGAYGVDDIGLDDLDFFDRGAVGRQFRRRIGFRIRYREIELEEP